MSTVQTQSMIKQQSTTIVLDGRRSSFVDAVAHGNENPWCLGLVGEALYLRHL